MLPPRILGLLVLLLAVQSLCKPTKSTEELNYEDDPPFEDDEEENEDDEADNTDISEAPPQILSQPMSIRVRAGDTVKLPCLVIHSENYAVAWLKDNDYLYLESNAHTKDKRIVRMPDNSLVIYNATLEDSSNNYKCSILQKPQSIDLIHRLLVDERVHQESVSPPQHSHKGIIRVWPSKRVEVEKGHSIKLGCETDIQPSPEIKWFIENKKVDGYDPDVILDGNYITIRNVNESHSGLYQCLAEDGSKMPAIEAINVIVHSEPKIEVEKSIVYSGTGIESEITCIVSGYPDAVVTWYRDDRQLISKKGLIMRHDPMEGNKTKHVLSITHTMIRDFGYYTCRAENTLGSDTKSIFLTGVPSQAKIYDFQINNNSEIILKWKLESYSPISEYKLQYRHKNEQEWIIVEPEVKDGTGNQFNVEYTFQNLNPGPYEAILKARNAIGWSLDSEPQIFTGDHPPDLALKEGNSATIQSPGILLALILVLLSCAFTSL